MLQKQRTKKEIAQITTDLKFLRKEMFNFRKNFMCDTNYGLVACHVVLWRHLKQYFTNPTDIEDDIQIYIGAAFQDLTEFYDNAIHDIIYIMEQLLLYPNVPCGPDDTYICALMKHLKHNMGVATNFVHSKQAKLIDFFQAYIVQQIPKEIRNEIDTEEIGDEIWTDDCADDPNFWFPFEDPRLLDIDNYDDEFTQFLKMKWIFNGKHCVCGKKFGFKSISKHLHHQHVTCRQHLSDYEIEYLRNKGITPVHPVHWGKKLCKHKHSKKYFLTSQWRKHEMENQPEFSEREKEIQRNNDILCYEINGKFRSNRRPSTPQLLFKKLKRLFMEKCMLQKREQIIFLDFEFKTYMEIKSKCFNQKQVEKDIIAWRSKIESEIISNLQYLHQEIQNTDFNGDTRNHEHYFVQSLENFVKWRIQNSASFIKQMSIILSRNINNHLPPIYQIELPCVNCYPLEPNPYVPLKEFIIGFKRFDPSEL